MSDEMKAILIAFFGGGGVTAIVNWLAQRNKMKIDSRIEDTRWTWQEAQDIMARYREDISALRSELLAVKAEVTELRTENRTLRREKETLQQEVDLLTAEVGRLREEIRALRGGGS